MLCKDCGMEAEYYDSVSRRLLDKGRQPVYILVKRYRCRSCCSIRRYSDEVVPYKHYSKEIIDGVLEGLITPEVLGFEDYPSEMTMARWRSQILQPT